MIKVLKWLFLLIGKGALRKELDNIAQERMTIRFKKDTYYGNTPSKEELVSLLANDPIFMARCKDVGWGIERIEWHADLILFDAIDAERRAGVNYG